MVDAEAVRHLRNKTCVPSFLWQSLERLSLERDQVACPIGRGALARIETPLRQLQESGHLRYSVEEGPAQPQRRATLMLRLSHLSSPFRAAIRASMAGRPTCLEE
ncbi:MAG: hypothetical protein HQL53_05015 [Magnetococcales bacterium]|nr:hypothetical protein [Magnetococcales bacterium]